MNGAQEVKDHPYFSDVNWDNVSAMQPPFKPIVKKAIDLSWFDKSKQFDLKEIELDMIEQ
jgi:hypothetical protein